MWVSGDSLQDLGLMWGEWRNPQIFHAGYPSSSSPGIVPHVALPQHTQESTGLLFEGPCSSSLWCCPSSGPRLLNVSPGLLC